MIDELAKAYSKDKKCEVDEAKKQLEEKLSASDPKAHGATVSSYIITMQTYLCFQGNCIKVKPVLVYSFVSSYTGIHRTLQSSHYPLVRELCQTFKCWMF